MKFLKVCFVCRVGTRGAHSRHSCQLEKHVPSGVGSLREEAAAACLKQWQKDETLTYMRVFVTWVCRVP